MLPSAAMAQSAPMPEDSILAGDFLVLGAGGIYGPSYDGSDDYSLDPIPYVQGRVAGIGINPRSGGIGLDLIPDSADARVSFSAGPVVGYSRNRRSGIKDPVVKAAGRLKSAVDLGITGGVSFSGLTNPYDILAFSADVMWNVNNASDGMVVIPRATFITPVSRGAMVSVGVSGKWANNKQADYYYSVSAEQSAASGLPQFSADSGWTSVGVGTVAAVDLDNNLLNGGFAVALLGSYSRMLEDARRTPYTSLRGDPNQWSVGLGIIYGFGL